MQQDIEVMKVINTCKLPPFLAQHYAALPCHPEEVTYLCEVCTQEVVPLTHIVDGITRYRRRECPCVAKAKEQAKQQAKRAAYLEREYLALYGWLGPGWSDLSLRKRTFAGFEQERQPYAYQITKAFAASPQGVLLLYGTFGTGKTHLLAAMCNAALEEHTITGRFTTAPRLFSAIQQRIQHNEDYQMLLDRCVNTPLLVIDDIDKAKHTDFREEVYFSIIDARTNAALPTAISTNRIEDLADYVGGAVCSRLKVGQIAVEMTGVDYREEL